MPATSVIALTYILPVRAESPVRDRDLDAYLTRLAELRDPLVQVIVVDGSPPNVFVDHARRWQRAGVEHVPVDDDLVTPMGKVGGVLTGLRRARHEWVVIADDDVRYEPHQLIAAVTRLSEAEVVRPQNTFEPIPGEALPWHARWDTGRALIARALGGDWPGTLAVRRDALLSAGGYRGDVIFENLELVRTLQARGGREHVAFDLVIPRRPPTTRHFWSQRVRQAYDEFARPRHLAWQLGLLPMLIHLVARRKWRGLTAGILAGVLLAEIGRRRGGARRFFPPTAAAWAPLWLGERAICSWLALLNRLGRGGVRYHGRRLAAANSVARLQSSGPAFPVLAAQARSVREPGHPDAVPHYEPERRQ